MKKFETISAANFEAMSKKAIDNQPLRKEVSLKTLQVLHDDVMSIDGRPVKMTTGAFKDLCKIVGLPVGFDKTFTGTFGDKARQALINRLKTVAASKGSTAVSLVLAPGTRQIVGIQKDPKEIISNRTFLDTTTRIIDRYGLEVNSFSVGTHGEGPSTPHLPRTPSRSGVYQMRITTEVSVSITAPTEASWSHPSFTAWSVPME